MLYKINQKAIFSHLHKTSLPLLCNSPNLHFKFQFIELFKIANTYQQIS